MAPGDFATARELRSVDAMKRKQPKKPVPIRPVPEKVLEQTTGGSGSAEPRRGGWDANHNHKRLRVELPKPRREG